MSNSENRKRTKIIMVRVTPREHEMIESKSQDTGITVPEFLRACATGRRTRSAVDSRVINELRRLGGLQKLLFNESGGGNSAEYAAILQEIEAAIERVGNQPC